MPCRGSEMQVPALWLFFGWQAGKNVHLLHNSISFLQHRATISVSLSNATRTSILRKERIKNYLAGSNSWFVEKNSKFLLTSWTAFARRLEFIFCVAGRVAEITVLVVPSVLLSALFVFFAPFGRKGGQKMMGNRARPLSFRLLAFRILTCALRRCGGAFIKAGQWASTRPDILPEDLCQELYRLHSDARPHPRRWTLHLLQPLMPHIIKEVEMQPIGCGTVAQVHRCSLWNGTKVAVKITHPNIRKDIEVDLAILHTIAKTAQIALPSLKWINLPGELDIFSTIMHSQCDMRIEYQNLQQFCKNFNRPNGKIAFPIPIYANQNVLVESLENGTPLQHFIEDPTVSGRQKDQNARIIFKALMKMILKDNFIHADLHPGNILVRKGGKGMIFLDAGLATKLRSQDHRNFIDLFRAIVIHRDGYGAGKLLIERSHPLSQSTVIDGTGFCKEIQKLVARTFKSSKGFSDIILSKVSFSVIFKELLASVKRHHVKLNENYANIITSILCIEGIGRQLSHGINLLPLLTDVAKLYVETKNQ